MFFFKLFASSSSHKLPFLQLLILVVLSVVFQKNCYGEAPGAKSPPVPALIIFGDSIVDPGNNNKIKTIVKCDFPPYGQDFVQHKPTGRFSNGKIPSDFIVSGLGLKEYLPAYLNPNLTPDDLLTGVSFASGGSGYDELTPKVVSALSLSDQLELFKEYLGKIKQIVEEERAATIVSESVYLIVIGTDDLANTYFTTPFRKKEYDISSYANLLAKSASNFYQELYKLGARKIGVVGLPPVGCVPSQRTLAGGVIRECVETYNQAAKEVNAKLSAEIDRLARTFADATLLYIDIYSIVDNLIKRPSDYGFEVSNKGCCGTGKIEVSVLCNPLVPPCEDVTKYVFWDSYHPTEKAYKVITDYLIQKDLPRLLQNKRKVHVLLSP